MSTLPIDFYLDQNADWKPAHMEPPADWKPGDLPYATHEGALEIFGHKLRCCRLNTGEAVFIAEDMEAMMKDIFAK